MAGSYNNYRRNDRNEGRRAKGPRGPRKLGELIADVIIRRGYARQMTASAYQSAWQAATDEGIAAASRPGKLRRGVLEVTVKNSSVLHQLTFQKKKILKVLNNEIEDQQIDDLRFRIGNID